MKIILARLLQKVVPAKLRLQCLFPPGKTRVQQPLAVVLLVFVRQPSKSSVPRRDSLPRQKAGHEKLPLPLLLSPQAKEFLLNALARLGIPRVKDHLLQEVARDGHV